MNKNIAPRLLQVAATLAILISMPLPTRATLLWENNFNAEITNTSNNTPNAGYDSGRAAVLTDANAFSLNGGMTLPSFANNLTIAGGRGSTVFAPGNTGFATNSVGMYSHPNQYQSGQNQGDLRIQHLGGVNGPLVGTTSGQVEFGFKLSLATTSLNTSTWIVKPTMSLNSNYDAGGVNPLLSIGFSGSDLLLTSSSGAPGGSSTVTTLTSGLVALTPVSVTARLDMSTRSFTLSLDGSQVGGTYYLLSAVGSPASNYGISGYKAVGGAPDTASPDGFTHYYDDIYLQTIPEPSTAVLFGVSTLALIGLRRWKSRHQV